MRIIDHFGDYSGFRINWKKSVLIPLKQDLEEDRSHSPLKVVDSFKCLEIQSTLQPKEYTVANVNPLVELN